MKAIKETGNELVAAYDLSDSVGVLDTYFPNAHFFTEFERFERHIEKLRRQGRPIDYVTVCSPNYLHDAHIRFGLRVGANVICEKPLVISPWNVTALEETEKEYLGKIYSILQLRLHNSVIELKNSLLKNSAKEKHNVELKYYTARGKWYQHSWKGNSSKSGGIVMNIGIHFFDLLIWLFGNVLSYQTDFINNVKAQGNIEMERARVKWNLNIDHEDFSKDKVTKGATTFRSLFIDGHSINLTEGFDMLHTKSYQHILSGNGYGLEEVKKAITLVHDLRNVQLS